MKNKDFINELSLRLSLPAEDVEKQVSSLEALMTDHLQENDIIALTGFGTFEVKKKTERVSVNPTTGKRLLIPPKLTLMFKQSGVLKNKVNAETMQTNEGE
ncbi:MAG: HU family DNA-binding protein [Bacteroidaceae bacterium]|nr:HU family DNA-binding protein [Bacteroidaceae bacterium]